MSILITESKQIVDTETGEVLDRIEHRRKKFVWFNYNINDLLDNQFTKAEIFRIFYLATFIDYDNVLQFRNNKMTKNDMKEILDLPKSTFYDFYNKLIQSDVLNETVEGYYEINEKYFYKGKVKKGWSPRIYCSALQEAYQNTEFKDQTKWGYGFAIMPLVNLKYNIICNNPLEFDLNKIEPLEMYEIFDEIGIRNLTNREFLRGQNLVQQSINGYYINPSIYLMGFEYDN